MKLVLLTGPQAVGKMTVGQELEKITQLKLFHNHATIELVKPLLPLDEGGWALVDQLREAVFRAFAQSGQEGMIVTLVCLYPKDLAYVEWIKSCFLEECPETQVYFVELRADLETRRARNHTENRLLHKPSKRNFADSDHFLEDAEQYRQHSEPGEITEPNYLCIDNTARSAQEVAREIQEHFWPRAFTPSRIL